MSDEQPVDPLRPLGVTELLAELNRDDTGGVTAAMLERDAAAGSPRAADGTVDIVHYAAWLLRESGTA